MDTIQWFCICTSRSTAASARWEGSRGQYIMRWRRALHLPWDHTCVQYFLIVHERKPLYMEYCFQYYIFQGEIEHTMSIMETKVSLALSSCMASYNWR